MEMRPDAVAERAADRSEDVHLRSCKDVIGYHIAGTDDEIGDVEDFICDDEAWAVRYLLVDTRNWWPGGKKVLLATHWIDRIDWTDRSEEHTSELQSLMRISSSVFCLKKKTARHTNS